MDQHDDTIQIPFRKRIEVGETKFSLDIPRYKIDDEAYTFEFESLKLIPEFYSQQAQILDFDPEAENDFIVENPFQYEFTFTGDFYDKSNDNNKWTMTAADKDIATLMKNLNAFFDRAKPAGTFYPPATIDWVGTTFYDSGADMVTYHRMAAETFYGEKYDPAKHDNALPPGQKRPTINDMIFPSKLPPEELKKIVIIRLTLAPNVKLGFSNDKLLKALGFFEGQYLPKTHPSGQVFFPNNDPTFAVQDAIMWFSIDNLKDAVGTKVTLY